MSREKITDDVEHRDETLAREVVAIAFFYLYPSVSRFIRARGREKSSREKLEAADSCIRIEFSSARKP